MSLKHAVLSVVLIATASVSADTIGWGGNNQNRPTQPTRPGPSIPPIPPSQPTIPNDSWGNDNSAGQHSSHNTRQVESLVQNYFIGQSKLNLLADYYIVSQLRGQRVLDVTVIASTEQGQGRAALILNGQSIENSVVVARQMAAYKFKVDPFANTIGRDLRSIELSMQGRFYVEKVIFNVLEASDPRLPGPRHPSEGRPRERAVEIVRQQVNQQIDREGGLELSRLFNLGLERQGQIVRKVSVLVRNIRGYSAATLLVNGRQVSTSQSIGSGLSRITFDLGAGVRIGQDMRALRLLINGSVLIDEVSLEIVSGVEQRIERGDRRRP
ncbi:MAG: hypothetical protein KBD76_15795 [Bacteriovorax sp.]|jgi:hypothetical protein|nr:hypothetical protein [Bacteriovorax sp.]